MSCYHHVCFLNKLSGDMLECQQYEPRPTEHNCLVILFRLQFSTLHQMGAFAIFFSWINFLFSMDRFPCVGIYVIMIWKILLTFLSFFAIFFFFILAFALGFHILLANQVFIPYHCIHCLRSDVAQTGSFYLFPERSLNAKNNHPVAL